MKKIAFVLFLVLSLCLFISCDNEITHIHEYNLELALSTEATCKSEGSYVYMCKCGDRYSMVVPKTQVHTPGSPVRENETLSTCTVAGTYDEVVYCKVCETELSREHKEETSLEHAYDQQVATEAYLKSAATCTEKAVYYESCVCGEKGAGTFTHGEALGHDIVSHEAKAATCTEIGWASYETCTRCDYTTYTEIPATGHTFNQHVATNEHLKQNIISQGKIIYYKSCICGENGTETFSVDAEDCLHSFENGVCILCGLHTSIKDYSIEVQPYKTRYSLGSSFDPTGLILRISRNDGSDLYISSGFTYEPIVECGIGNQIYEINYTYEGVDLAFLLPIIVDAPTPVSLSLVSGPIKTNYFTYESFDSSGISVEVAYDNGRTKTLSSGFTISEPEHSVGGEYEISIQYTENGKTVECATSMTVIEVIPSELIILSPPNKTSYIACEDFDSTGLVIRILNNDGSVALTTATGLSFEKTVPMTAGDSVDFEISYEMNGILLHANQNLKILPRTPISISVSKLPTKTSYLHGESFNPEGIEVTATYNVGKDAVLIDGFSFDTGNMLETTDFHEVVLSYTENNATVNCSVQISLSHGFVKQCTDPSFLLDNEYSDLEALFYHSCACGEHNETSFVHVHSFNEEDICRDCGFYFENSHLLEIKNNIITGLTVDASSISGKLILPNGITGIDASAFSGCSSLTSIEIPSSVTSIGDRAFYGCSGLTSIVIPSSVTSIGGSAFEGCSGLKEITLPFVGGSKTSNTYLGYIFGASNDFSNSSCVPSSLKRVVISEGVTSIGRYAFYGCSGLTSIVIPSSVTSIGRYAFEGCSGLEEITLPFVGGSETSNTYLGYIFGASSPSHNSEYVPSSLKRVVISEGATCIEDSAFWACSGLTSIDIPSSVTSIEDSAFYGCHGLTSIVIPEGVTSIESEAFWACSGLTSIVIPSSVESIGIAAFCGCSGLTSIDIPSSVTSIGGSAFYGCNGLTSIEIPSSVTSIGYLAFYGCTGLTSIEIPSSVTSIEDSAFYGCSGLTSIEISSSVTSIEDSAFYGCSGLTSIVIPSSVTSIGYRAFYGCSGLKSIVIPSSVTSIGGSAFYDCNGLEEITLPFVGGSKTSNTYLGYIFGASSYSDNSKYVPSSLKRVVISEGVTSIGRYAFEGCSGLTSIEIPSSVTSIGDSAFEGCSGLEEITLPFVGGSKTSNTYLGYIFGASSHSDNSKYVPSSLKRVVISEGVTSIEDYAFYRCSGLKSIVIPSSVTSIGGSVFYDCIGLEEITLPFVGGSKTSNTYLGYIFGASSYSDNSEYVPSSLKRVVISEGVTSIEYSAFCDCKGLTSIVIPSSVTSIGGRAFEGCSGLTSIEIPSSVTSIEVYAFYGCKGLTSIEIPSSVTSIGNRAFYDCSGLTSIVIPSSVESIGIAAFCGCSGLTSIDIPSSVTSIGGSAFYGCNGLTSIEIPSSVTSIEDYAFYGCSGLTSIEIPSSVTSIGKNVFGGCSGLVEPIVFNGILLRGIVIDGIGIVPEEVTSIGSYAFYNCRGLTSIKIPSSVTSIGDRAFYDCSGLTSIEIPSGITSIEDYAFYDCCGLTSIVIPSSVTSIGSYAFSYTSSSLVVKINKPYNSLNGSPWGALGTIIWAK